MTAARNPLEHLCLVKGSQNPTALLSDLLNLSVLNQERLLWDSENTDDGVE